MMGPIVWKCLACLPIVLAVAPMPQPQSSYYRLQLKEGGFLAADSCSDLVALATAHSGAAAAASYGG